MNAIGFIHDLRFADLPPGVVAEARRCLLDLAGVAAAGISTDLSRIVRDHAARHMQGGARPARLILDGRSASPAGAAFAGAFTIDSFDAHDGHPLTKGHAGVVLLPTLLALADAEGGTDGREMLTGLVLGYEIAIRAGIALHASVPDYHTSGAWNGLACAALVARRLGLDPERTRHALGIAEYHGPRSQMMRVIDHPTMLKDGSGWGAFAGVTAGYLAADGFTGAPAITVEAPEHREVWADLGRRWRITEQYLKPQPVCRWAQPAIEALLGLMAETPVAPDRVAAIEVATFAHAVALGAAAPTTTEEAQYAIGFPLAAALVRGRVGPDEIWPAGLRDPAILAALGTVSLVEDPALSARFPAERLARVRLTLADGTVLASPTTGPRGDAAAPLSNAELQAKFATLASGLGTERCAAIEAAVATLDRDDSAAHALADLLLARCASGVSGAMIVDK